MGISHRLDLVLRIIEQGSDQPLVAGLNEFWIDAYPVRPSRISGSFFIFSDLERSLGKSLEHFETIIWCHECYQKRTLTIVEMVKNDQTQEVLLRAQPSKRYPFRDRWTGVHLKAVADQVLYRSQPDLGHERLRLMLMADAMPGEPLKIAQPGKKDLNGRYLLLEEGEKREVVFLLGESGIYDTKTPLRLKFTQETLLTELVPLMQVEKGIFETYFEPTPPKADIELIFLQSESLFSKVCPIEKGCLNDLGAL